MGVFEDAESGDMVEESRLIIPPLTLAFLLLMDVGELEDIDRSLMEGMLVKDAEWTSGG